MAFENGVNWKPLSPDKRGKFETFSSAIDGAVGNMIKESNPFFDSLEKSWKSLFSGLPLRLGRIESGVLYLYVPNIPTRFAMERKLYAIRKTILSLPGAPKRLRIMLETRT